MADMTKISTPVVTTSLPNSKRADAPKGYAQAGDVSRRANVLNEEDSPQNKASLKRLDHALHSDQPLRGDVPTGYYLNITI
ncbi:MAG: hypothetical protein COB46_10970 [Rhodospirillaceae bacterium]|nr:MAG: hypothetical protein COB46_10970 [Rhodospirillaceae bacterium]